MGKKYYAVKKGRKTGVFTSWVECQMNVEGFSGAIFKSFSDYNAALQFIQGQTNTEDEVRNTLDNQESEAYAYIDGSYDNEKMVYGFGVLIVDGEKQIAYKFADNKEELVSLRNVAGEIEAAKYVMQYAVDHNLNSINIFYDYAGIEMWAKGIWRTNLQYTKDYVKFYKEIEKKVKVSFSKVKAHSGNELNEKVDLLAKEAVTEFFVGNKPAFTFEKIKGNKSIVDINIYYKEKIISSEVVTKIVKQKWKSLNRTIKEIKELKSIYDLMTNKLFVQIVTENENIIIEISGDEIDG